jgi:uncharacterized caspase-like protein
VYCALLAAGIGTLAVATEAAAQAKVALVVGNGSYTSAPRLPNPANDAADMAATLRNIGFEVVLARDVGKAAFDEKLREFARLLRNARTAAFFYAGHGIQVAGKNYAIPVDAKLENAADLQVETVDIDHVLAIMQSDENRVNLVFLDACRDNPLTRSFVRALPATRAMAVGTGLSPIDAGRGTLIAFATAPNKLAMDGGGRNSPFTAALLRHIRTPGLDIAFVMRRVTAEVEAGSRGAQVPWMHASLSSDVVLVPGPAPQASGAAPGPASEADEIAWTLLRDSNDIEQLQRFINRFPNSARRQDAAARIAVLRAREAKPEPTKSRPTKPVPGRVALGAQPILLGSYQDWGAYAGARDGTKVCFAISKPVAMESSPSGRGAPYLLISSRPADNVSNEVSVIMGYALPSNSDASLRIGSSTFPLYIRSDSAWVKDVSQERQIVDSMQSETSLIVSAVAAGGKKSSDRYSLKGFRAAIERAAQECRSLDLEVSVSR